MPTHLAGNRRVHLGNIASLARDRVAQNHCLNAGGLKDHAGGLQTALRSCDQLIAHPVENRVARLRSFFNLATNAAL